MFLTIAQLLTLNYIPEPEELSLKTIAEFYDTYLKNKQYKFLVKHKEGEIRVRFESGALPHLLGIQHFISGSEGRGERAHWSLKKEVITFNT